MRRKSLTPVGETEMEVLHHVWELKQATVAQVHDRIMETRKLAYTTVMTVMKNLADKGFLQYERDGATYVYSPAREPEEVQGSLVSGLVAKVFRGSPAALVQTLVQYEDLSEGQLAEIRRIIGSLEEDDEPDA
jgi:BlaI family transcriptional regulator, penicillinase repressor